MEADNLNFPVEHPLGRFVDNTQNVPADVVRYMMNTMSEMFEAVQRIQREVTVIGSKLDMLQREHAVILKSTKVPRKYINRKRKEASSETNHQDLEAKKARIGPRLEATAINPLLKSGLEALIRVHQEKEKIKQEADTELVIVGHPEAAPQDAGPEQQDSECEIIHQTRPDAPQEPQPGQKPSKLMIFIARVNNGDVVEPKNPI